MKFDKPVLSKFRGDFSKAVAQLEKQYGVEIALGAIRFTEDSFTSKITVVNTEASIGGVTVTKEALDFKNHAIFYDLKPEDLGTPFKTSGKSYTICGLKPRSHKYPILCECAEDGKRYKFPAERVKQLIK